MRRASGDRREAAGGHVLVWWEIISPTCHPALRRLRSLRSLWGLRRNLRSRRSLRNLASADCASSGRVVSQDDVLPRFRGQRHRKSIG
jgi:hypothetical protein